MLFTSKWLNFTFAIFDEGGKICLNRKFQKDISCVDMTRGGSKIFRHYGAFSTLSLVFDHD